MQEYHAFVTQELLETWESWLHDLGRRIGEQMGGLAPEPGVWTDVHRRHFARMGRIIAGIREGYEAASFSTRAVTRGLMDLVRVGRDLAAGERHWADLASRRGELRTALALELAAARALAQYAAPIMPEFSKRLWSALGGSGTVESHGFDPRLTWVESGAHVNLAGELFARVRAELPPERAAFGADRMAALG
jgi:methionyl-tRNA synthetase